MQKTCGVPWFRKERKQEAAYLVLLWKNRDINWIINTDNRDRICRIIVIDIMNQFDIWESGFLIVVETVFPPIPSELILTFGGFLTTCTEMTVIGVILVSTAASVAGALSPCCTDWGHR